MSEDNSEHKVLNPSKYETGESYDLKNELGYENGYDTIAGKAQIIGTQLREPSLIYAGAQLAQLIRNIPYDNDRFYQVIAKANDLEKEIEKRSQVTEEVLNNPTAKADYGFTFRTAHYGAVYNSSSLDTSIAKNGMYSIVVDGWRAFDNDPDDVVGRLLANKVMQYLRTIKAYDDKSIQKHEYKTPMGTSNKEYLYKDETGIPSFLLVEHEHENGKIGRMWVFYFKEPNKLNQAWNEVKSIVNEAK